LTLWLNGDRCSMPGTAAGWWGGFPRVGHIGVGMTCSSGWAVLGWVVRVVEGIGVKKPVIRSGPGGVGYGP
jgi:hypothetical protein